jgi:hypothetical protein
MIPQPLVASFMRMLPTVQAGLPVTNISALSAVETIDHYYRPMTSHENIDAARLPDAFRKLGDAVDSDQVVMRIAQRVFWQASGQEQPDVRKKFFSKLSYTQLIEVLSEQGTLLPFLDLLRQERGLPPINWKECPEVFMIWGGKRGSKKSLQGLQVKMPSEMPSRKMSEKRRFIIKLKWDNNTACYKMVEARGTASVALATTYVQSRSEQDLSCVFAQSLLCEDYGLSRSLLSHRPTVMEFQERLQEGSKFLEALWRVKKTMHTDVPSLPERLYVTGRVLNSKRTGVDLVSRFNIAHEKTPVEQHRFCLEFVWNEALRSYQLETELGPSANNISAHYPLKVDVQHLTGAQKYQAFMAQLAAGPEGILALWRGYRKSSEVALPVRPSSFYVTGKLGGGPSLQNLKLSHEDPAIRQPINSFKLAFTWDPSSGCYKITKAQGSQAFMFAKSYTESMLGYAVEDFLQELIMQTLWQSNASDTRNPLKTDVETVFQKGSPYIQSLWAFSHKIAVGLPEKSQKIHIGVGIQNGGERINRLLFSHNRDCLGPVLDTKYGYALTMNWHQKTHEYYVLALGSTALASLAFAYLSAKYQKGYEFSLEEKIVLLKNWGVELAGGSDIRSLKLHECIQLMRGGSAFVTRLCSCLYNAQPYREKKPEHVFLVGRVMGRAGVNDYISGFNIVDATELSFVDQNKYFVVPIRLQDDEYVISYMPNMGLSRELSMVYAQAKLGLKLQPLHPNTSLALLRVALTSPVVFHQLMKTMLVEEGLISAVYPFLPDKFALHANVLSRSGQLMVSQVSAGISSSDDHNTALHFKKRLGVLGLSRIVGLHGLDLGVEFYVHNKSVDVLLTDFHRSFLANLWSWTVSEEPWEESFNWESLVHFFTPEEGQDPIKELIEMVRHNKPRQYLHFPQEMGVAIRVSNSLFDSEDKEFSRPRLFRKTKKIPLDHDRDLVLWYRLEGGHYAFNGAQGPQSERFLSMYLEKQTYFDF